MLTLYHNPISQISRRVWIVLLEKKLEFELVEVNHLEGEQFKPSFLEINPFHHIPVLVDDGFKIVESLAILDYIEAKYSTPAMLPNNATERAIVRMVQLVTANELFSAFNLLISHWLGLSVEDAEKVEQAKQQVATVLKYFENLLDDRPYFGSQNLTLAEVVAGTVIPWLPSTGVSLCDYPKLNAWCHRLVARPAWQATAVTIEAMEALKSRMVRV
ncbi:MAG: glutathione S-transferase family protein [Rhizonema sp. PD38]|nr:glutathione S-transferase family protein [Rhizonema sp. PD38]